MKRIILILLLILYSLFLPGAALSKGEISINELIENAAKFDGRNVVVRGEAIGDILQRKEGQWINILDNGVAIGVWSGERSNLKKEIEFIGGYKTKGDFLQVTGVFNRVCSEHGGDIDIHAKEVDIIKKGNRLNYESKRFVRLKIAIFLSIAAILALVFNYLRSRKYL